VQEEERQHKVELAERTSAIQTEHGVVLAQVTSYLIQP
jgi:hypothetical protein